MKHAWFSQKYYNRFGGFYYLDKSGKEVCVSEVSEDKNKTALKYDDIKYVGLVEKFVRCKLKKKFIRKPGEIKWQA